MDCNSCKKTETISYIAHEGDMARMERSNRRLWITNIVLILAIITGIVWFVWREAQFEDVVITQQVEQEAESGDNQFIGGDFYGTAESTSND